MIEKYDKNTVNPLSGHETETVKLFTQQTTL